MKNSRKSIRINYFTYPVYRSMSKFCWYKFLRGRIIFVVSFVWWLNMRLFKNLRTGNTCLLLAYFITYIEWKSSFSEGDRKLKVWNWWYPRSSKETRKIGLGGRFNIAMPDAIFEVLLQAFTAYIISLDFFGSTY